MINPRCHICQGKNAHKITVENDYTIFLCKDCKTVFVDPLPDKESLADYYNRLFYKIDDNAYSRFSTKANQAAWDYIVAHYPKGRVLDVGCGYGHFMAGLSKAGFDVEGLDLEPLISGELKITKGRIENAPFPDESFSLVTLWWVLEHTLDPIAALSEVRRILQPKGKALVRVPNTGFIRFARRFRFIEKLDSNGLKNPVSEKNSVFDLLGPPHHLHGFSKKSMEMLGQLCGFKNVRVLFLEQVLTQNRLRDSLDRHLYHFAKSVYPHLGRVLYHDLVVELSF